MYDRAKSGPGIITPVVTHYGDRICPCLYCADRNGASAALRFILRSNLTVAR